MPLAGCGCTERLVHDDARELSRLSPRPTPAAHRAAGDPRGAPSRRRAWHRRPSPRSRQAPRVRRRAAGSAVVKKVTIEILRCAKGHGLECVAVNDLRITSGKCCGSWRCVRRWTVDESDLLEDLKRAGIGETNINTAPVAGEN